MIQIKLSPSRLWLLMVAIVAGICTSCSDITDSGGDTSLPDGKYPMTFSAAVDGLTVSRAATGKDAWTVNDEIAISVDGGARSEKYKITSISSVDGTGTLSPATTGECCYWQQNKDQQILAWYPAAGAPDPSANPTASYVDISNQQNGFSDFDYLTANVTTDFTTDAVSLPFKHQMAKVKCTLEAGEGINDTDLQSAEVKISGYTQVTFTKGTLSGIGDNGWITPGSDKEALVVPQDMAGKQFIKVTVGTGNAARDYYYTPGENNAALESGNAYTYAITVKKEGLQVASASASWGNGTEISGSTPSTIENYKITITDGNNSLNNLEVKDADGTTISAQTDGTYQLPATATSFSVSYTVPSDKQKSLVPTSGLCRMKRTFDSDNSTYTCHYSSVVSDVTLALDDYAEAGDYYYSDGSWTPETPVTSVTPASGDTPPTAIGVVFYSGAGPDDDVSYYNGSGLTGKIHGYVVAAKDLANYTDNSTCYGGRLPIVNNQLQSFDVSEIANGNYTSYNGYSVTKIIKDTYIPKTTEYEFPVFAACATYEKDVQAAPTNSSGWYLPSAAMLGAINGIKGNLEKCPGGSKPNKDYLSCSESGAGSVQGYAFHQNVSTGRTKNDNNDNHARAVLTF